MLKVKCPDKSPGISLLTFFADKRSILESAWTDDNFSRVEKLNMIKIYLPFAVLLSVITALCSCNHSTFKNKIQGNWKSEDGKTKLKITTKDFVLNEWTEPIAESYFVKEDSIFTSYEGSQPFTKFVVKNLSNKSLTLVYPDSTSIKFVR